MLYRLSYTRKSGERGIRTPDTSPYAGFQDRCNRPLYHLSINRLLFVSIIIKEMRRGRDSNSWSPNQARRFSKPVVSATHPPLQTSKLSLLNANFRISKSVDRKLSLSRHRELNSGPHPYQGCALPLSYDGNIFLVGVPGFEPGTPCSQSRCANRTALHPEGGEERKSSTKFQVSLEW